MSELQLYYDTFKARVACGEFSDPDPALCGCHGGGWFLSEVDTWHECPAHRGRRHPDDEPSREPWLRISVERPDGSEFEGSIGVDYFGEDIEINGTYAFVPETPERLDEFKTVARRLQDGLSACQGYHNKLVVRLRRRWVEAA